MSTIAYTLAVIASFRSKALKQFWTKGDASGLRPDWRKKITLLLSALDAAIDPSDLNLPGFGFHPLTGALSGRFALTVSRNWRMTFGWETSNATELELEDYHGA